MSRPICLNCRHPAADCACEAQTAYLPPPTAAPPEPMMEIRFKRVHAGVMRATDAVFNERVRAACKKTLPDMYGPSIRRASIFRERDGTVVVRRRAINGAFLPDDIIVRRWEG